MSAGAPNGTSLLVEGTGEKFGERVLSPDVVTDGVLLDVLETVVLGVPNPAPLLVVGERLSEAVEESVMLRLCESFVCVGETMTDGRSLSAEEKLTLMLGEGEVLGEPVTEADGVSLGRDEKTVMLKLVERVVLDVKEGEMTLRADVILAESVDETLVLKLEEIDGVRVGEVESDTLTDSEPDALAVVEGLEFSETPHTVLLATLGKR